MRGPAPSSLLYSSQRCILRPTLDRCGDTHTPEPAEVGATPSPFKPDDDGKNASFIRLVG
jgi:hypothetical protein